MNNRDNKVLHLVVAALFAALICVATMVFTIPLPGKGYLNTGDCFVILAGCLMGPIYGTAAGAVGSALADMILGYGIYMPGTFVIKGLMALAVYLVFRALHRNQKHHPVIRAVLAGISGEIVMIAGYFIYETVLFSFKSALGALVGNCIQGAGGIILSTLVMGALLGNAAIREFFPGTGSDK